MKITIEIDESDGIVRSILEGARDKGFSFGDVLLAHFGKHTTLPSESDKLPKEINTAVKDDLALEQ